MRINYYQFPNDIPEDILLKEGCEIVLKNGETIYSETIPEDKRELVDHVDNVLYGLKVSSVKSLIKKYGGHGWTDHCERDGGVFETTEITLNGNNSKFKYNRHL